VDGLRLDAVHAIGEQAFLIDLARRIRDAIAPERHVHLVLENEHNNAELLAQGYTPSGMTTGTTPCMRC